MSEQILCCADMCLSTFKSLFQTLDHVHTCGDTLASEIYYYRDMENYTSIILILLHITRLQH